MKLDILRSNFFTTKISMIYFIFFIFFDFIQTSTIKIQVLDVNENPIFGANIEIINSELGTSTDENGFFLIKEIDKISKIRVSHIKYSDKIIDLSSIEDFKIKLIEKSLDSNPVVVTGTRRQSHIKDVPVQTRVINIDEIQTSSVASVKELLEIAIPNIQDVMSSHAGVSNNEVKIKGLDNSYILFMIDGSRISGENFGNLDFSMLNISNVERIEVVEGGMSSLYGSNAIGGVVNIITKKTSEPFELEFSYLNESPMVESKYLNIGFKKDKFNYRLNASNQLSDGYDLTPELINNPRPLQTLEKYNTRSIGHSLRVDLNESIDLKFEYKNYKNKIYQYQNNIVQVLDESNELYPFYYYTSLRNGLPWFGDKEYKFEVTYKLNKSDFKFKFHQDKYQKTNYYFNYTELDCGDDSEDYICLNQSNLTPREYLNAKNYNKNFFFNYHYNWLDNNYITIGYEKNINKYSSFNIYNQGGDLNDNGLCDDPPNWDPSPGDCIVESVFGGVDTSEEYIKNSAYIGGDYSFGKNFISISARNVSSKNYGSDLVTSFALLHKKDLLHYRFNYSKGFRTPTIKELFYDFQSHPPPILGNPNLKSTTNDYYSFSVDKRTRFWNNAIEFYFNDVVDMIGTNYFDSNNDGQDDLLMFNNYSSVKIYGLNYNLEYNGEFNRVRFVYNYTKPRSRDNNALELISNHSARIKYSRKFNEKVNFIWNTKFLSEKFIYSSDDKIELEAFSKTDLTISYQIDKYFLLNFGIKNIFDYVDNRRFLDDAYLKDILSTYDPGQRFFIDLKFSF